MKAALMQAQKRMGGKQTRGHEHTRTHKKRPATSPDLSQDSAPFFNFLLLPFSPTLYFSFSYAINHLASKSNQSVKGTESQRHVGWVIKGYD